jgi:peptidoglycan-associated lipoprotein
MLRSAVRSPSFRKSRSTIVRLGLVAAVMFTVSACSSDDEAAALDQTGGVPAPQDGALNDVYQGNGSAAAPGTQADLVVNVGDRVFFGYDQYNVSDEARVTLDKQAKWLQQYANLNITVEGHADERGTREYNLALGERRANAVKNYLIAAGVAPTRINTISYGKERPAVPGSNDSAWAQNRRGVTKVE